MKKIVSVSLLVIFLGLILIGCGDAKTKPASTDEKLKIALTIKVGMQQPIKV